MEAEAFIARWRAREGGAERANFQMFIAELCDVIGVMRPDPAGPEREFNNYVFERAVRRRDSDTVASSLRIDLYKKGCFILEGKQSRLADGAGGRLDALMARARRQAEDYVFLLDASHPAPPFILVCDVGRTIEIYADFSGTGRAYTQFRGRTGFRITLEDLSKQACRELLRTIWTDPESLNPARENARVTRQVADRLAMVSRSLERNYPAEEVALFMMRTIFCMFAEDVDLLPKGKFTRLLEDCVTAPRSFVPLLEQLWSKMDACHFSERYFPYFDADIRYFNGNLYRDARAFPLAAEEIAELVAAARHKWTEVDPAIFGTLLEQALDPVERRRLGAHYTPRAYVERLVEVTVMEPLRVDWRKASKQADDQKVLGRDKRAVEVLRAFHHRLCTTRVLDPACGTANFLYVCLQMIKALEGEVLEALAMHGETDLLGLDAETVGPRQFLGLEINPRAAAIAELVIWIGFLQEHYRIHSGHPGEPVLRAFTNINFGRKDGYDAVLAWDGDGFENPRRPNWPQAEFIVGNPPFIGGKDLRARLGAERAAALWRAHPQMNESADFVMYWWDRAAELLTEKGSVLRRFGLVTTNSISQVFQRRTVERHLNAHKPISLIHAVPDHPWTKATRDSAAVRIAMTVCEAGKREGVLLEVVSEAGLDTDEPKVSLRQTIGSINTDLTIGTSLAATTKLLANAGLASRGVVLHGAGFIVTPGQAEILGLGRREGLEEFIRPYRHGKDISQRPRGVMVIDLYPLPSHEVRQRFPEVYQHVLEHVKPHRDKNNMKFRRENWWWFGATHEMYRDFSRGLRRLITTPETAKHRIFSFIDGGIRADNMLVNFGSDDAMHLAILSSRIHTTWALAAGGWLGIGNDPRYSKSRCFDSFPFPDPAPVVQDDLRAAGEELDATRKRVLDTHPDLTLTGLYNVLEKVKAGADLTAKDEDVKDRGLVLILKELHETIDRLAADAYGWPADLDDETVLARLVTLNGERAAEEARGLVRWLRPDYQAARFGKAVVAKPGRLALDSRVVAIDRGLPPFPTRREEQVLAVASVLACSRAAMNSMEVARAFKGGGKRNEPRVATLLLSLARYGHVVALGDGRFAAREGERLAA